MIAKKRDAQSEVIEALESQAETTRDHLKRGACISAALRKNQKLKYLYKLNLYLSDNIIQVHKVATIIQFSVNKLGAGVLSDHPISFQQ